MASWVDNVERRAAIVMSQMAAAIALAPKAGLRPEEAAQPYGDILGNLYRDEMPLARLLDSSDLVVEFKGPAVDRASPILKVVSNAFYSIREEMQRVTRAIVGLATTDKAAKFPDDFELALSGLARGSLTVGISVTRPGEAWNVETQPLLGVDDPLYQAVRGAIRSIALVTKHIGDEGVEASISEDIPDPAVRDALTVAAKRLAPTGRQGIETVSLYSPEIRHETHELTPEIRRALTRSLRRPVSSHETRTFEGVVREIDLDARRFEIRNVRQVGTVRCIYQDKQDQSAKRWLDARIKVSGLVARAPSGEVRLMQVETVKMVEAAKRPQQKKLLLRVRNT